MSITPYEAVFPLLETHDQYVYSATYDLYTGLHCLNNCVDTQKRSWKESIMLTVVLDCLSLEHVLVLRSAKSIDDNVWVYDLSMLIASGWLGQSLSTDYLRREGEKEGGRGRGRGWEGEGEDGREREGGRGRGRRREGGREVGKKE